MTTTPPPGFGPAPDPEDPPLPPGFSSAALSQSPGVYQPPNPPSPRPARRRGRGKLAALLAVPVVVVGLWVRSCVSEGKEAADGAREAIEEIGDGIADPADYEIAEGSCENSEQVKPGTISPIAKGTITNTSDEVNSFVVEVEFTGEGGEVLATETETIFDVKPGASDSWTVYSFVIEDGDTFDCTVSETYYNVARLAPSGD